jgi:CheY-like chemotaxis protein
MLERVSMAKGNGISILIADDEVELRKAIAFDFKRKGFSVFEAGSGDEAFEIVKNNNVQLILSDVRMPNGDGISLLDKVKAHNPQLPVLLVTGFADISLEEAYDRGASAVFPKPFDRKVLLETVMKAVTQPTNQPRKFDREEVNLAIALKFPNNEPVVGGRVMNLGRGGFFLQIDTLPNIYVRISFSIQVNMESLGVIEGTGIVRWIRSETSNGQSRGCGVEFESMSDDHRLKVTQVVNILKTKAHIPKGLA